LALLNLFRSEKTVAAAPQVQGYVDERSTHHISGWMRDLDAPERRLDYEIVLPLGNAERVLGQGRADAHSDVLVQVGVGDGDYAFRLDFEPPLSLVERDRVFARPVGVATALALAPELRIAPPAPPPVQYQGYIDERSIAHVSGWVWDLRDPAQRVEIEIMLAGPGGERVLACMVADQYNPLVQQVGVGDGSYAFFARFDTLLDEAQRDSVFVRPVGSTHRLEMAPALNSRFEPINHIAMDIVNNCNLRCPFCVYDYSATNKTMFMSEETFDSVLRLIPFVTDGNFWLSCLHEATLHPQLMEFIARVPRQYRHKLFFTTNLAKRMPERYFSGLATSGMSHINISLESLDQAVYERMRKGARFKIFEENWAKLLDVFGQHESVPRIRYNMMAYRSNLLEIPRLTKFLLEEKHGAQIEIRNTFDGPQIDTEFRNYEFLTSAEWAWLANEMKDFPPDQVILLLPPGGKGFDRYTDPTPASRALPVDRMPDTEPTLSPGPAPRPFSLRVTWDGMLNVYSEQQRLPGDPPTHQNYMITNINKLEDPLAALFAL
jgi:pyruvate-formate lyase-activating enzyme